MRDATPYDAVIVGSGPNGLAAAATLAREGHRVLVLEAAPSLGGGTRTAELTLPGYHHDVCSAAHPLGIGSPFLSTLPLKEYGLRWVQPPTPLAHPFDDGTAATLERSVDATAAALGEDGAAYASFMQPLVDDWAAIASGVLGPLRLPEHPVALARFGLRALRSAKGLVEAHFAGERAQALVAGVSAHAMMPLDEPPSAAFGLLLTIAGHAVGWPLARGGSQAIADALAAYVRERGGAFVTGRRVASLDELPPSRAVLFDVTPRQLLRIAGPRLPSWYRHALESYRYGPGAFKLDWALDGPIPWAAPECARAGTVHLGATLDEMTASEAAAAGGRVPESPFVIVVQPSLFDDTRAPPGRHTAWGYCHVPHGSTVDMTERIERQIERFAPGFRDRIVGRHVMGPNDLERYNANYVGGDINGGKLEFTQIFMRPIAQIDPYEIPLEGHYLCSSSTPPGGGVHGMCGYWAARSALEYFRRRAGER